MRYARYAILSRVVARRVACLATLCLLLVLAGLSAFAATRLNFETSAGPLSIYPVGHGSLYFTFQGLTIHVDPWSNVADYSSLPKADHIWITHEHPDHLDRKAIDAVLTGTTTLITDPASAGRLNDLDPIVATNGDTLRVDGIILEVVPAYNLVRERAPGQKYHPKGMYNGYIANFGDFRVYIAGDTECVPEMKTFGKIDLAFIPINLPFTMPPEEAIGCIKVLSPRIVVPYHQGNSDPHIVAQGLAGSGIEVIVLPLP